MNNQSVKFAQIPLEVLPQRNNLKCRLITQGTEGVARFMLRIQIVIYQLIFERYWKKIVRAEIPLQSSFKYGINVGRFKSFKM